MYGSVVKVIGKTWLVGIFSDTSNFVVGVVKGVVIDIVVIVVVDVVVDDVEVVLGDANAIVGGCGGDGDVVVTALVVSDIVLVISSVMSNLTSVTVWVIGLNVMGSSAAVVGASVVSVKGNLIVTMVEDELSWNVVFGTSVHIGTVFLVVNGGKRVVVDGMT